MGGEHMFVGQRTYVPFLIEKVTKIKHFAKRVSPSPEIFESQKNMVNPKIKSIMNYYLSAQSFW
jgi:hypothetical protein